jgi:hypothetical protein
VEELVATEPVEELVATEPVEELVATEPVEEREENRSLPAEPVSFVAEPVVVELPLLVAPPEPIRKWEEASREPVLVKPGTAAPETGANDPLPVFTMSDHSRAPTSTPELATTVFREEIQQVGWGVERDWHVRLGLLLEAGGFVALWQNPPLTLFAVALWVTGGVLLLNRKRPPAEE